MTCLPPEQIHGYPPTGTSPDPLHPRSLPDSIPSTTRQRRSERGRTPPAHLLVRCFDEEEGSVEGGVDDVGRYDDSCGGASSEPEGEDEDEGGRTEEVGNTTKKDSKDW